MTILRTMKQLKTVSQVVEALGGPRKAAQLPALKRAGIQQNSINMWRSAGKLPAKTYLVVRYYLRARGFRAPRSLWGMIEP